MNKVRVYKIGKAIEERNEGKKEVVGLGNELAIIVNGDTAIIIEKDACHWVKDFPETFKIGIATKKEGTIHIFPDSFVYPTVEWLINNVEYEEVDLSEWIMYYNIKSRIISNCTKLRESIKDLGLNDKEYLLKNN